MNVLSLILWLFVDVYREELSARQDWSSSALCIWVTVFWLCLQLPELLPSSRTFSQLPHASVPLRTAFCSLTREIHSLISSKPTSHHPLGKVFLWKGIERRGMERAWGRQGDCTRWAQAGWTVHRVQNRAMGPPGWMTLGLSGPQDLTVWKS